MITLENSGIYLVDGKPTHTSSVRPEEAKKGTIAYKILSAHNTSGNDTALKIRFDALVSHDITYVGIIQTARASGLTEFPLPYALTNCHNSLCAVGGTINEDDHVFGLSAARKYGGIYVPANQSVIHSFAREELSGCGKMILGSDSHTRYGALGTMGVGEGGPELVKQLLKNTYDVAYPGVVLVYLTGKPRRGVGPHDVAIALTKAVFANGFVKNKVLEFTGPGVASLPIDFRNGIDVMTTETTCLSSIWETDDVVKTHYAVHGRPDDYKKLAPEKVAYYDSMITIELDKIEPMQQADFEGLMEALMGQPVTIRFLDPPLHEFVPTDEADIKLLAKAKGKTVAEIKQLCNSLHEFNPMMGHRGCRLAVTYPEIAVMQTKAVIKAAIAVQKRHPDWHLVPEIMIPLVGEVKELAYCKKTVVETADAVIKEAGVDLKYEVGTMIEIPRAALTADEIAKEAEFFCFGTNDLTQMTFGFSRDDAGKFLPSYYAAKIYESDPFARLDTVGVGKLMKMAVELGHKTRNDIHCGICGEHGGDPSSIEFCHEIGLNYVSCSPYRVPIARLAAAQANIRNPRA